VRDIRNQKERELKIIEQYKNKSPLSNRQMEQMITVVSTVLKKSLKLIIFIENP